MTPADDHSDPPFVSSRPVPPEIACPADDTAYAAMLQEAIDELDSGLSIPVARVRARVRAWVESWGAENELPPPEPECE